MARIQVHMYCEESIWINAKLLLGKRLVRSTICEQALKVASDKAIAEKVAEYQASKGIGNLRRAEHLRQELASVGVTPPEQPAPAKYVTTAEGLTLRRWPYE